MVPASYNSSSATYEVTSFGVKYELLWDGYCF